MMPSSLQCYCLCFGSYVKSLLSPSSLGWEDPLEKGMATHSSTVAWKIPWTEERGRLQSMGLQRVRHDWATSLSLVFPPRTLAALPSAGLRAFPCMLMSGVVWRFLLCMGRGRARLVPSPPLHLFPWPHLRMTTPSPLTCAGAMSISTRSPRVLTPDCTRLLRMLLSFPSPSSGQASVPGASALPLFSPKTASPCSFLPV